MNDRHNNILMPSPSSCRDKVKSLSHVPYYVATALGRDFLGNFTNVFLV